MHWRGAGDSLQGMATRVLGSAQRAPLLACVVALVAVLPAAPQDFDWKSELHNPIRAVLNFHYNRPFSTDITWSVACLAERGDVCFGGDHEDEHCLRAAPCRNPAAMRQFVGELERAVRRRPGDPYAVAQAAYGVARLGDPERALELAGRCEAAGWWCDLVLGMAHQRAGRSVEASGRFLTGLLGADPELACRLTDITYLLDGRDLATYAALPCPGPERREFEERFWWLSDPLLTRPGNDRWTEHLARRFELLLHERLRFAVDPDFRLDTGGVAALLQHMDEVTRRGHPDSWDHTGRWRSEEAARYQFTPASLVVDGVQALRYELEAARWDEGYTPAEYGPIHAVPGQVARFRDADSLFLAVAADLTAAPINPRETRFVASGGPTGPFAGLGLPRGDLHPSFTTRIEAAPMVVAVEALDGHGGVSRMRAGVVPLGEGPLALSDPLVVDPGIPDLPATRAEAARAMLPHAWIGSSDELVVYWEVYGMEEGMPLDVSVAIGREGAALVTRVLRSLTGRPDVPATVISWTEEASGPTHGMSLSLQVDALDEGRHQLTIEATGPDGASATSIRRFEVRGR